MAIRILSSENITGKLTLTGQQELLELTRGGASDSKWFFSADSTKLYIAESTSATQNIKVTLKDDGNVGIGTITPDAKLEIFAGASTTQDDILWGGIIRNNANSAVNTGYGAGLKLKVSSDTSGEVNKWAGVAGIAGSTFSNVTDLAFYANPTASNVPIELMRLTGEGNLVFNDSTLISSNTSDGADDAQIIISGGGASGDTRGASIHLSGNENGNGGLMQLRAGDGSVGGIRFYTGGSERMRLAGRLITFNGTTGVQEIRGDVANAKFAVGNMGDASSQMMVSSRGFLTLNVSNTGSALDATERLRIDSSGNISVGTDTPLYLYSEQDIAQIAVNRVSSTGVITDTSRSAAYINLNASNGGSSLSFHTADANNTAPTERMRIDSSGNSTFDGNVGIGMTTVPSQKLEVQGNVKINGTVVEEGSGNNKTFRYRTTNSSSYSGGNALVTFGRFYWTPAHWVDVGPVLEVTLQCKYYVGEQRKYIITAGYGDNEVIVNELQPSSSDQKITLQVGAKTAAGYNYASQPVYYVDLQWTQTSYTWGWAQLSQQVPFLTANPTSGWGGVVVYSAVSQNNNAGTPQNYGSFFAGDIGAGGEGKARFKSDGTNTYVDAIPANSEIRFRVGGAIEKFRIASSGATTQTMDSTTSLSHLWSQGIPLQNIWYTVYTYSQYDSVCFFAMVSFENDAGDGANQSAMFATSAGAAYGAAFGVQQISGGTGIEARRSSTSFQVRQTIGGYTSSTRLNVRFVSIN